MDSSPYLYLIKNSLLITTHKIIGLWTNHIYSLSTNGSLWTLPVEFLCYIFCFIAYKIKIINKKNFKYTFILFLGCLLFQKILYMYFPTLESVLPLFFLFYMGMITYIYFDKIPLKNRYACILFLITIISLFLNIFLYVKIITIPYLCLWLSFECKKVFTKENILKLSYEIYLWGFLIQQIIYELVPSNNPYLNFSLSIIPTLIMAYILNKITNKLTRK